MKKLLPSLIPLGLLAAGYLFWCYAHTESYCFFYPSIDTRFAPGFSERTFSEVSTGMTMRAVQQKLGSPLAIHRHVEDGKESELWSYSLDGACKWGDWAWLRRQVDFTDGKVVGVIKQVSYD